LSRPRPVLLNFPHSLSP